MVGYLRPEGKVRRATERYSLVVIPGRASHARSRNLAL